jgi:hypothetical protein
MMEQPDEVVPLDNPAGRLVHFIQAIAADDGTSVPMRLASVLNVPHHAAQRPLLLQRLGAVWRLVDDLEQAIREDPHISQRHLSVLPAVMD